MNDACGCVTPAAQQVCKRSFVFHRSTYLQHNFSNAGNFSNEDTLLLIVPQFHVIGVSLPVFTIWF
jgi:fatty-acyl-CoA synthase